MVCVCKKLQAFCIFGLNCLLAGRSDALRVMIFNKHIIVMNITFAAWWEVNIEFAEPFFCEAVDVRFWFGYIRKNVRRYVRKHVKRYIRKNVRRYDKRYARNNVKRYVRKMPERISEDISEIMSKDMSEKIYQKICQKECQKIYQKEWQKIASRQSAKLRITKCISGNELYIYPYLTRSG